MLNIIFAFKKADFFFEGPDPLLSPMPLPRPAPFEVVHVGLNVPYDPLQAFVQIVSLLHNLPVVLTLANLEFIADSIQDHTLGVLRLRINLRSRRRLATCRSGRRPFIRRWRVRNRIWKRLWPKVDGDLSHSGDRHMIYVGHCLRLTDSL